VLFRSPAWSADQLAERPEITAVPEEFDGRPLRPRFVYRLESIEDDPRRHELTDADGFTFFTTSPESAAALALNFAYDGYRPTSENFSVYRYRLPENADIQRDHTLFNLDKMTSGQERVAAVKNAHEAMGLPLDAYRYAPAGEIAGTVGKRIDFPESPDLMKIYRAIRRGGKFGGIQFMPAGPLSSSQVDPGLAGVTGPDTDQGSLSGARFMPDVANAEDLTSAVASILSSRNVRDDRAKKWLREAYRKNFVQLGLSQGRERASLSDYRAKKSDPDWMRKPGLQSFKSLKAAEKDRVGHIADYLNTLDERELSKLPKQTFADIEKKVAEWDKMLQKKMGERAKFVNEGKDIETLETFEDGFRVVRLLSKGAYEDEGKCMGHCVGSYNPKNKNQTILSLRGPDGESHATLELFNNFRELIKEKISEQAEILAEINAVDDGDDFVEQEVDEDVFIEAEENVLEEYGLSSMEDVATINKTVRKDIGGFISQIKGKANKAPLKKYADKILRFIQNSSGRYAVVADGENLGLVKRNITDLKSPSPFYLMGNEPDLAARFMPGSSQVGQSLAGVTAPDTDQGPLSGARFMPGYNPRYTDDDGNFDREAWLADIKKGEEYLRSRGITRANTKKDLYEQMLREALRGPRR
jgi:hypothetical protein